MYELFDPEGEPPVSPVVRKEQQIVVETVDGVLRRLIHSAPNEGVEMVVNEYAPGTASAEAAVHHQGHEYGIVIAGALVVELDGEAHRLRTHDAISYSSAIPHRIHNPGRQRARAIWFNLNH
jgi:quercetin dioxygenase-like cupin family protein